METQRQRHRRTDVVRSITVARAVDLRALTAELARTLRRRAGAPGPGGSAGRRLTGGFGRPAGRGPLLELLRAHAALFAATLDRGTDPTADEVAALAHQLRRCAAPELGLDDIERAYRAASEIALRHLAAAADPVAGAASAPRPGLADPLDLLGPALTAFTSALLPRVTAAYLDLGNGPHAEAERHARHLLAVVDGGPTDGSTDPGPARAQPSSATDRLVLAELGLDGPGPFVPFAAVALAPSPAAHAELAAVARRHGCLAASEADRVVGVTARESTVRRLAALLAPAPAAAPAPASADGPAGVPVARPGGGAPAVAVAAGRPALAGHVGSAARPLGAVVKAAAARGLSGLIDMSDHGPEALVALEPDIAEALVDRIFGPLPPDLADTVVALVHHDFDRRAAAEALAVHRNTVLYRCGRIEELTGLDLGRLPHRTLAYLAVARRNLSGAKLAPVEAPASDVDLTA